MQPSQVELGLGTVQFGVAYGVTGRGGPVTAAEVREILSYAWDSGIRVLDTAPVYGDIELHLGELMGDRPFDVVSKIPPLPSESGPSAVAEFVEHSIQQSRRRLGSRFRTVLFHRGEDLLDRYSEVSWGAATRVANELGLRVGASFYTPRIASDVRERFPFAVAQLPGNALDQRLAAEGHANAADLEDVEVHVRSVFLQGLLLLPFEHAVSRVPKAASSLAAWRDWCAVRGLEPLVAALGVAKSLPGLRCCVVGVDTLAQLEEIIAAWREAPLLEARSLSSEDEDVIDPRRWTLV
jgi:hypothetical protein